MNKKEMIEKITKARHNDAEFFYCVFNVGDINDASDKILNRMSKDKLQALYEDAVEIMEDE